MSAHMPVPIHLSIHRPVALPKLVGGGAAAHCHAALMQEGVMLIPEGEFGTAEEREGPGADARLRIGLGRTGMEGMLEAWGRALDRL